MKYLKRIFENKRIIIPQNILDELQDICNDLEDDGVFKLSLKKSYPYINSMDVVVYGVPYISIYKYTEDEFAYKEIELFVNRIVNYLKGEGYKAEIKYTRYSRSGYITIDEYGKNILAGSFRIGILN